MPHSPTSEETSRGAEGYATRQGHFKRKRGEDGGIGRSESSCGSAKLRRIVSSDTGRQAWPGSQSSDIKNIEARMEEFHQQCIRVEKSVVDQQGRLVALEGSVATSSQNLIDGNKVRDALIAKLNTLMYTAERLMQEIDSSHHSKADEIDLIRMEAKFKEMVKTAVDQERNERESDVDKLKDKFTQELSVEKKKRESELAKQKAEHTQELSNERAQRLSDNTQTAQVIANLSRDVESYKERQVTLEQKFAAATSDSAKQITQLRKDMKSLHKERENDIEVLVARTQNTNTHLKIIDRNMETSGEELTTTNVDMLPLVTHDQLAATTTNIGNQIDRKTEGLGNFVTYDATSDCLCDRTGRKILDLSCVATKEQLDTMQTQLTKKFDQLEADARNEVGTLHQRYDQPEEACKPQLKLGAQVSSEAFNNSSKSSHPPSLANAPQPMNAAHNQRPSIPAPWQSFQAPGPSSQPGQQVNPRMILPALQNVNKMITMPRNTGPSPLPPLHTMQPPPQYRSPYEQHPQYQPQYHPRNQPRGIQLPNSTPNAILYPQQSRQTPSQPIPPQPAQLRGQHGQFQVRKASAPTHRRHQQNT
jgi:hypothetical protein